MNKSQNTRQTEKLVKIIRSAYQPPTTGHIRDLIEACTEFLEELEENEYQAHRARHISNISYILG